MKKFFKLFKWFFALILLLGVCASGGLFWFWLEGNAVIRRQILAHIEKTNPGWKVDIRRAELHTGQETVSLYDFELGVDQHREPLLRIPELIVGVNRDALLMEQRIKITAVRVHEPEVLLSRSPDGRWNWQDLPMPESSGGKILSLIHI